MCVDALLVFFVIFSLSTLVHPSASIAVAAFERLLYRRLIRNWVGRAVEYSVARILIPVFKGLGRDVVDGEYFQDAADLA